MIQKLKKKNMDSLIAAITAGVVATNFLVRMIIYQLQKSSKARYYSINASGIIQPEEEVQITSMVSGWITEITVVEGDTVNPDQHLISIDQKQYRAAYDQAAHRLNHQRQT